MTAPTTVAIDEAQQLLIHAVCRPPEDAREAWCRWRQLVDFEAEVAADRLLLLTALARRPEVIDGDSVAGRIRGLYRRAWVSNQVLWQDATTALEALRDHAIPTALVDGAAVVDTLGDLGARPLDAVDILVMPTHAQGALAILGAAGWAVGTPPVPAAVDARTVGTASLATLYRPGETGRLRLHWRAVDRSLGDTADADLWHASVARHGPGPGRRLHAGDLLLRLLVAGRAEEAGPSSWVVDAYRVITTGPPDLGERLAHQARAYHQVRACIEALSVVAALTDPVACRPLLDRLHSATPGLGERLGDRPGSPGRPRRAIAAWSRYASGGTGWGHGLAELVADRLDLSLATRPAVTLLHVAVGRAPAAARLLGRSAPLARVHAPAPSTLAVGRVLDFTDPGVVESYGGPGWRGASDLGAHTKSNEARLVLPFDPESVGPVELVLTFAADQRSPVLITVDDRPAGATPGRGGPARVTLALPARRSGRATEVAFRSSDRRAVWPGYLFLILRSLEVTSGTAAP
ncbi:MAG: nucleotidyltransferase family protein [Acidimicrobiales bacterium]